MPDWKKITIKLREVRKSVITSQGLNIERWLLTLTHAYDIVIIVIIFCYYYYLIVYRWTFYPISTCPISSSNDKPTLARRHSPTTRVKVRGQGHWESSTWLLTPTHEAAWHACSRWRHDRRQVTTRTELSRCTISTRRMRTASWQWCCSVPSWTSDIQSTTCSVLPPTLVRSISLLHAYASVSIDCFQFTTIYYGSVSDQLMFFSNNIIKNKSLLDLWHALAA